MPNLDNLTSLADRPEEERKEIARLGGIASGEARRENARLKKELEKLLNSKSKKHNMTYYELATLGLIQGAMKGDSRNYKVIAQMMGELDTKETQVNIDWTPLAELIKITPEEEKEHENA